MTHQEVSFPQDEATGLQDTIDWNDAGGFAWLAHHPNTTDQVIEGFEFDYDPDNDILRIGHGVANIYQESTRSNDHTDDGGTPQEDLHEATFRVQKGPSGDINLNSGVNHVYLGLDQNENNTVEWFVNTSETPPPEPYLYVGSVDTATGDIVRPNDNPGVTIQGGLVTTTE